MSFTRIAPAICIVIGLYGIINLFIGKRKPLHIKKGVQIINKYYKYYKYYYLFPYIIIILWGITPWFYGFMHHIYFYYLISYVLIQVIGVLFIDPKYTSK